MNFLFEKVDNSKLIVFRIFFGLLMTLESWGAIATGWVRETFIEPTFTFHFLGFGWTQVLTGETMYIIYGIMGVMGILIMLGAFYRGAIITFFVLWSLTYYMQKSHYNNHYYLVMWVSFIMAWLPANGYLSIDANISSRIKSQTVSQWNYIIFIVLVSCVYVFAAIAKITPGWLDNHFLTLRLNASSYWFEAKLGNNFFSDFLRNPELGRVLSYAGIVFDFLIVPLLLFKPTRYIAFISALIFHLFNSLTLHIGIFPYFALALCLFFFDDEQIKNWFLPFKTRNALTERVDESSKSKKWITAALIIFTALHIYLPLRHHLIPGDVTWTEEGHRMAWRMMLRSKTGTGYYETVLPNGKTKRENFRDYLAPHQINDVKTKPDMIWQFAQKLKESYAEKGIEPIKVFYKRSKIKINDGPYFDFIDPEVNLADVKWSYFGHQPWILPAPEDYYHKPE